MVTVSHEMADIFPMMSAAEVDGLAADLKTNGLHQPIILYDGKVLDGRNRLAACKLSGTEPRFEEFDGTEDEALALVLSLNLARRHLTTAQKATLAVNLLPVEQKAASRRMLAGTASTDPTQDVVEGPLSVTPVNGEANALAGAKVGISKETVRKAKRLAADFPLVFGAMEDGTLRTMGEAERLASLGENRRSKVLARMRDEGLRLRDAERRENYWSRPGASSEWYTPDVVLDAARRAMGGTFDLDPASSPEAQLSVQADRFFTVQNDGLSQPWTARRLWLNPPYGAYTNGSSKQGAWVEKLLGEHTAKRVEQAVLLVRSSTSAVWFSRLWGHPICFVRGRLAFVAGPGVTNANPTVSSAIVGVGVEHDAFVEAFSEFGHIVLPSGAAGVSWAAD